MAEEKKKFNKNSFIESIRRRLAEEADEKTAQSGSRFFKEPVKLYGVKTANVTKMSRETFKEIKRLGQNEIYDLCGLLWESGYLEEQFVACNWSNYAVKNCRPEDFYVFENWLKSYVDNWASCDTLCNHTIGSFIEMHPDYISKLLGWTKSENRWMRRGSAVTLIIPARKGRFLKEILEIADNLLLDKDDLVQKGYGWLLKSASESHRNDIFDYVIKNRSEMPRTALRYAIEKMPQDLRKEAMKK